MIKLKMNDQATTFPLKPLSKEPAVPWRSYEGGVAEDCTTYGIDCQRSGLVVIDLDRLGSDKVRFAALRDKDTKIDFLARRVDGAYKWYQGYMADPELPASVFRATNSWRYSGDNIRLWMEECLERDVNSAALNEDLRDSYNNWLEAHGYAPISHKVFLSRLEEHPLYLQWGLKLAKASRIGKLELSQWRDPMKKDRAGYEPRHIGGGAASHVKFVRFAG